IPLFRIRQTAQVGLHYGGVRLALYVLKFRNRDHRENSDDHEDDQQLDERESGFGERFHGAMISIRCSALTTYCPGTSTSRTTVSETFIFSPFGSVPYDSHYTPSFSSARRRSVGTAWGAACSTDTGNAP